MSHNCISHKLCEPSVPFAAGVCRGSGGQVRAHIAMAYVVMAYIVMAQGVRSGIWGIRAQTFRVRVQCLGFRCSEAT